MEQHPIPQQISSYQFKLVGDMTLKQFFQVAGGVIVGLIFYSTPLHPLIKWPFIIFFTLLGAALAFLPFEERPLERWIIAFFRSIYSPTLYTWKKSEKPPVYYTESAVVPEIKAVPSGQAPAVDTVRLEEAEKSFLSKIGGLWNISSTTNSTQVVVQQPTTPPISAIPTMQTAPTIPTAVVSPTPVTPTIEIPKQVPTVITKSAPRLAPNPAAPAIR